MQVKLIQALASPVHYLEVGTVLDLPEVEAVRLLEAGIAEKLETIPGHAPETPERKFQSKREKR